jgi:hypothetical protein
MLLIDALWFLSLVHEIVELASTPKITALLSLLYHEVVVIFHVVSDYMLNRSRGSREGTYKIHLVQFLSPDSIVFLVSLLSHSSICRL